jgi:bacterioferritin-associated ferredoxin
VYVCLCKGISESQVRELGQAGICSADALASVLGLEEEEVCGRCLQDIEALVAIAANNLAGTISPSGEYYLSSTPPQPRTHQRLC